MPDQSTTALLRARASSTSSATKDYKEALKSGEIVAQEVCSVCGKRGKTVGHHDDYSKPLDVIWMCSPCHARLHGKTREKRVEYLLRLQPDNMEHLGKPKDTAARYRCTWLSRLLPPGGVLTITSAGAIYDPPSAPVSEALREVSMREHAVRARDIAPGIVLASAPAFVDQGCRAWLFVATGSGLRTIDSTWGHPTQEAAEAALLARARP